MNKTIFALILFISFLLLSLKASIGNGNPPADMGTVTGSSALDADQTAWHTGV